MPSLVAGLFGKLPAHGDFVTRGWPEATVAAIDRWLTEAMRSARAARDDAAFAEWMRAAPMWQGYVPPDTLGPLALHVALTPSIDRAGRLFPLVGGVAGPAEQVWAQAGSGFGAAMDAAVYDALAGRLDADAMLDALAAAVDPAAAPAGERPAASAWWLGPPSGDAPLVEARAVDAALLDRLLCEGQA